MISGTGMSTPMTESRARRLEGVGFMWNSKNQMHITWDARYQELTAFVVSFSLMMMMMMAVLYYAMSSSTLCILPYTDSRASLYSFAFVCNLVEKVRSRSDPHRLDGERFSSELGVNSGKSISQQRAIPTLDIA
jgi:hypothetical protein